MPVIKTIHRDGISVEQVKRSRRATRRPNRLRNPSLRDEGSCPSGASSSDSAITVVGLFVALECLLRVIGFGRPVLVERMVFTFPIDEYNQNSPEPFLQRDAELFWKPKANVVGHNSLGFYGPEFSEAKDPSVFRIVCLGDSCTHFGPISYPDMLRAVLDAQAPGRFEVINAGVIGYTSYQGMKLLDTRVMEWSPDLVIVYFGWNDHWLARGVADNQQSAEQPSGLIRLLADTRVFQLASLAETGGGEKPGFENAGRAGGLPWQFDAHAASLSPGRRGDVAGDRTARTRPGRATLFVEFGRGQLAADAGPAARAVQ